MAQQGRPQAACAWVCPSQSPLPRWCGRRSARHTAASPPLRLPVMVAGNLPAISLPCHQIDLRPAFPPPGSYVAGNLPTIQLKLLSLSFLMVAGNLPAPIQCIFPLSLPPTVLRSACLPRHRQATGMALCHPPPPPPFFHISNSSITLPDKKGGQHSRQKAELAIHHRLALLRTCSRSSSSRGSPRSQSSDPSRASSELTPGPSKSDEQPSPIRLPHRLIQSSPL